jgi:hypothetical protein
MESAYVISKNSSLNKISIISSLVLVVIISLILYINYRIFPVLFWVTYIVLFFLLKSYLVFRFKKLSCSKHHVFYKSNNSLIKISKDEIHQMRVSRNILLPFFKYFGVKYAVIKLKSGEKIYFNPLLPKLSTLNEIEKFEKSFFVNDEILKE